MFFFNDKQKQAPSEGAAKKRVFGFFGTVVSDVGRIRFNNEDNYILGKNMNVHSSDHSEASVSFPAGAGVWRIAGVFDGMGGGEMGELASRDAASLFLKAAGRLSGSASRADIDLCMRKAFQEANNRIVGHQQKYRIFGTTGTVLCTNGIEFKLYHLGDSRGYLLRDGDLMQLTKDQTLAQMKRETGMYREYDPAAESDKHKLTEYIGRDWTKENLRPRESQWIPIQSGDSVLLCSDGLYDMCSNHQIAGILTAPGTPERKTASLLQNAILKGGEDNITCVLLLFT